MRIRPRLNGTILLFYLLLLHAGGCGVSGHGSGGERFITDIETMIVDPAFVTLKVGDSQPLSTHLSGKQGAIQRALVYSWSSNHPEVASVSARGVVRGVAEGTARIRATLRGNRSSDAVVFVVASLAEDSDQDGIPNGTDNAPFTPNPNQDDLDGDGIGDVADPDLDGDGIPNPVGSEDPAGISGPIDNCPYRSNPDQTDTDGDGMGDACDSDDDADGIPDEMDNCVLTDNPLQEDLDQDGVGDSCDPTFDPSPWTKAGTLPKGLYDHAAAYWNGVLYTSGGFGPGPVVETREIYGFPIRPDLSLGKPTVSYIPAKHLSLPTNLGTVEAEVIGIDGHGMVMANGYLYIIGGKFQYRRTDCFPVVTTFPCNTPTPTAWNQSIFYAPILSDGTISAEWTEVPLPAIGPYTTGVAIYQGYLYLAGGWDGSTNSNRVFRAPLLPNGEIGHWKEETPLPAGLSKHALVAAQGHLYILGGNTGSALSQDGYTQGFQSEVYRAAIDETDPLGPHLGSWNLTASLPDTWIDHEAVAIGNTLWVIGGRNTNEYFTSPQDGGGYFYNYTIHGTVQVALIHPDGTLTPWRDYNELPVPVLRHAVATGSDLIFLTGGSSGQEPSSQDTACTEIQSELCTAPYIRESGVYVLDPLP